MEFYFVWIIGMALGWAILFTGIFLVRRRSLRLDPRVQAKIITPLDDPFGSIMKLKEWAEAEAVRKHLEAFPDDAAWLTPRAEHPDMILKASGILKENELRELRGNVERTIQKKWHEPLILGTGPDIVNVTDGKYTRYLEGIGEVTADTQENLNRACEVVLQGEFEKHAAALDLHDKRLRSTLMVPDHSLILASANSAGTHGKSASMSSISLI